MTDPSGPSTPPQSQPPSSPPPAGGSATASGLFARLDPAGRLIAGGALAAIVVLLIGILVGAWSIGGYVIVALLAAVVALLVAFVASPGEADAKWPVPARDIALLAGVVMSVLAILNVIEVLFDLEELDGERGGALGLLLTIGLAVASLAVFLGAIRARHASDLVDAAGRRSDRGTRVALGGLGLDLVAWLIMLTISVYSLGPSASFGIAASVLAVLVLVLGADPEHPWRLPIPAAWVAIGISLVSAFTLLDMFSQWNRINDRLDAIDSALFFVHVIAVFVILAGAVMSAVDHQRAIANPPAAT